MNNPADHIKLSRKKIVYPVSAPLRRYLKLYQREQVLPISYHDLTQYQESIPVLDKFDQDSLWQTVIYPSYLVDTLHLGLKRIYALMKAGGYGSVQDHLFIDRIDYCTFGNTHPFRIKITNRYNDVYDYFYIKVADASRVYGLELEHLLSPDDVNFLVYQDTLVEEHISGIPGDVFIEKYLKDPAYNPMRIGKEFVKFNERCFMRLLGDMRAYNFVIVITPDFDDFQFRIRAIDFDQQSYEGNYKVYLPQFFKENLPYVQLALDHFNDKVMGQYRKEEQSMIWMRVKAERHRLNRLREVMNNDTIAPPEKVLELRDSLSKFYDDKALAQSSRMGEILEAIIKLMIRKKL